MKRLLIVYHSQSGGTQRMCDAVLAGVQSVEEITWQCKRAFDAGADDLRRADALIIGTPENFGYMSGAIKDFFDRTFYPCEHDMEGRPYGVFVNAGNDGSGAVMNVDRILAGLRMKKVIEPVIARKEIGADALAKCHELGATLAAGLSVGMF